MDWAEEDVVEAEDVEDEDEGGEAEEDDMYDVEE